MLDDDIEYIGSSHRERSADIQMTGSSRALTGFALNVEATPNEYKRRMVFPNHRDARSRAIIVGRSPPSVSTKESWCGRNDYGNAMFRCPVVSRKHAKFHFEQGGKLFVTDTRSHHGTHIRRHGSLTSTMIIPEHPTQLFDGDVITFGKTVGRNGELVRPVVVRVELLLEEAPVTPQSHANKPLLLADDSNSNSSTSPKSSSGRYGVFSSSASSSGNSSDEMEISSGAEQSVDEEQSEPDEEQSEPDEVLPPSIALHPTSIVERATGAIKWLVDGGNLPSLAHIQGAHSAASNASGGPPPPPASSLPQPPPFIFGSPTTQAAGSRFTFSVPSFFGSTPPAEAKSQPQVESGPLGCRLPPLWFQNGNTGPFNTAAPFPFSSPAVNSDEGDINSGSDSLSTRLHHLSRMQKPMQLKRLFTFTGLSSSSLKVQKSKSRSTSPMSAMDLSTPSPPVFATSHLEKEEESQSTNDESQSPSPSLKENHESESIQCAQQRDVDENLTSPQTLFKDSPHDAQDLWNAAHPYIPLPKFPVGWGADFDPWEGIEESLPAPVRETGFVDEDVNNAVGIDADVSAKEEKGRKEAGVVDEETGIDKDEEEQCEDVTGVDKDEEEQCEDMTGGDDDQDEVEDGSIKPDYSEEIQELSGSLDKFNADTNARLSGIDKQVDRIDEELKDISKWKNDDFARLDNTVHDIEMSIDAFNTDVTDVKATCQELETTLSLLRAMNDGYPLMVNDVKMDVDEIQSRVEWMEDRIYDEEQAHDGICATLRERVDEGNRLVKDLKDMFNEMHSFRESHEKEMKEARTDLEREIRNVNEIRERMERVEEMKGKAAATVVHPDNVMAPPPSPQPTEIRTVTSLKRKHGEGSESDAEIENAGTVKPRVLGGTSVDGVRLPITGSVDDSLVPATDIFIPTTTTTLTNADGVQVPSRKRSRVVVRMAQTATAITVGAVVTWTALAFS